MRVGGARFIWVCFVALLVLAACGGGKGAGGGAASPYAGNVALAVVNKTPHPIDFFHLMQAGERERDPLSRGKRVIASEADMKLEADVYGTGGKAAPPIPPGGCAQFAFAAGSYELSMTTKGVHILEKYKLDLAEPTELVIYDGDKPPTDPPTAGMKQVVELMADTKKQKEASASAAATQASQKAALETCTKDVPPKDEKPSPGKTKVDGKWSCVLGGSYSGTDYLNLVQLSDGHITATIHGADRNQTWEGAVVGGELHFRFTGTSNNGGRLKIDAGGRAMIGKAWTYTDQGTCAEWTLTCTKT